ncbi:MAG: hypothetical protein DRJ03_12090 [Chloroflexi bacterium]|nr:MAG: hypothetical protein DRI81_09940 [Chloroflexota bacterium]RLC85290.1 MAG: hypothetical protein DRJ03_12090 [Chloroflexota bacterium]
MPHKGEHMSIKRILIIDDEPLIRRTLADYLTVCGYETVAAANGDEGLALARAEQFHAILVDLRMPRVDGLEIVAALHAEQPELPLVVVSGAGALSDAVEAMRRGAWDYVAKPIQDMEQVAIVVERVLERAHLLAERKRAAGILRESEARFRDVALSTSDWVWEVDSQGRYTYCSERVLDVLGYSAEEVLGKTPFDLMPPGEATRVGKIFEKIARNREPIVGLENWNISREEREICLLTNGVPIFDREGNLIGYRGVDKDITERKRAEGALRQGRDKAQKYLDVAGAILVALNEKGEITLVSRKGREILGYKVGELLGRNWFDTCLSEDIREDVKHVFQQLMAGEIEPVETHENSALTKAGEERIIVWYNTVLTDETGKINGILSSGEDITERKRAEEGQRQALAEALRATHALRESEERYRELVERSPQGIVVRQGDKYVLANQSFADMVGYSTDELLEFTPDEIYDLVHPDDHEMIAQRYKDRQAGKVVPDSYEHRFIRKDGETRWARATVTEVEVQGERAFLGIYLDVTERKRAEEEARRRATQAALIYEVGQRVSGELELDTLLSEIVVAVQDAFGYYGVMLLLLDEECERLTMQSIAGGYADVFPDGLWLAVGEGMIGRAAATGETQVSGDVSQHPHFVRKAQEETRSELAVPIQSGERIIGVLDIQSDELDAFDEMDMAAMETLSTQIGAAIENARLLQDTRARAEELAVLNKLSQALTARLDVAHVLEEAYRGVSRLMDTTDFYIVLYQPDKEEIAFALDVIDGEIQKPYVTRRAGQGLAEHVIHTRAPLLIQENLPEMLEEMGIELGRRPAFSWVGVPLIVGDRVLGMMAAIQSHAGSPAYGEHDRDLLLSVASQTATALQNAYLFEETQRRATQLALINDIAEKIAAALGLESVLERAARLVQESFGYHHVAIFTVDREQGEIMMRTRAGDFVHLFPPDHRLKLGQGIVGWTGLHNETLLANDVDADPRYVNLYPDVVPTRSELCAPIGVGREVVGVLDVQSPQRDAFDENDVLVLETLADQIAVAIENARLYEEITGYAEQLEQRVQERTAQLAVERAHSDAILRSATDGIVVANSDGDVIQANPVAQAWLTQTLAPEEAARLREAVRSAAAQTEEQPAELLELTGLDLEVKAAPISGSGLEEAAAVIAIHDVSHLKSLDRMKSRFITNISHELRTPITTVKLYAHLMRQRSDKWEQYLDTLAQEAERLARLVEDILEISRVDSGRLEIKPGPTSLNELAESVVASHREQAQERGLALEYRPAEPGPVALVDSNRITQALVNLVQNGIRFTPQGGKVTLSTGEQKAQRRAWATVTVADTGMGIPEDELPHIFERFFRGTEPRDMQLSGTGLGLSIVKEIVELHGGRVTVESKQGSGSAFTVWLPFAE